MSVLARDSFEGSSELSDGESRYETDPGEGSESLFSSPESVVNKSFQPQESPRTSSNTRQDATRRLFRGTNHDPAQTLSTSGQSHLRDRSNLRPEPTSSTRQVQATSPLPQKENLQELIFQELCKANSRLDSFAGRLDSMESRLASVVTNQQSVTPTTSSCSSAERVKRKVPARVAVC